MSQYVRWLGAYRKNAPLHEAAQWERSQTERQIAVEPLHRGRSLLLHAKIGLRVDTRASTFISGWLTDAYTAPDQHGRLCSETRYRGSLKRFTNLHRFSAAWAKTKRPDHHAEAAFDHVQYSAVVVKRRSSARVHARARKLAESLELPLEVM